MSLRANRSPMATFLPEGWALEIGVVPVETSARVGSSVGNATVAGFGVSYVNATGSSVGSATANAAGISLVTAVGDSDGPASASATGEVVAAAAGESIGLATVSSSDALALAFGSGDVDGTSTADAFGNALADGLGASSGTSTVEAFGAAAVVGVGSSSGTSTTFAFTLYAFVDYASTLVVRDHVASLMLLDMSYQIGRGDLAPDIVFEAGVNGDPVDLSDAQSYFLRWWKPSGTVDEVSVTPLDISLGTFVRTWAPGDTDEVGTHSAKLIVIRGNGDQQTFPSDGSFLRWRVT